MRDIEFRGKSKETGKWVRGGYFKMRNRPQVFISNGEDSSGWSEYVDPETVGQYTGLKGENGIKIFEGDIIKNEGEVYEVLWNRHFYCWGLHGATDIQLLADIAGDPIEVIGNIYDNPELLEEKK